MEYVGKCEECGVSIYRLSNPNKLKRKCYICDKCKKLDQVKCEYYYQ